MWFTPSGMQNELLVHPAFSESHPLPVPAIHTAIPSAPELNSVTSTDKSIDVYIIIYIYFFFLSFSIYVQKKLYINKYLIPFIIWTI